jgi:predicted PurR-regulated permease PerM
MLGALLFLIVFELVRRKMFREELSIIWLFLAVIIASGSVLDFVIDPLSEMLHVSYPPVLAIVVIIFFVIIAFLYFSLVISDLKSKVKELTQKLALLEFDMDHKPDKEPPHKD